MRIGIDTGGTFTDFVVAPEDGPIQTFKLRSDPGDPARVILAGLARIAATRRTEVIHGSTVATNALLERKGARTALVTTAGFEDVIEIGRQNRAQLYVLNPAPRRLLVERRLRFGVNERSYFDGVIARRPSRQELGELGSKLQRAKAEAVAICFLHAYRSPENERAVAEALEGLGYVCSSHEICPEFREYERTSTTVLNAYIGPLMDRYLGALESGTKYRLSVMQSNGGLMTAAEARRHAVRTLLSGPAGGVVGAIAVAKQAGIKNLLAFDMGGTSTDVSLYAGCATATMEGSVDGFPVRVPMLDIHTVGAGGGSIARMDEGGVLHVGPESAGADPGPACYGHGTEATVTDANLVLGRIQAKHFLGGAMAIDLSRAREAIDRLARQLGLGRAAAARGIIRVANANMERAIRVVSVERGHDPRAFTLVAFGGSGGLHACEIAANLGIQTVLVPKNAGVLSALGMVIADQVRDYAAGVLGRQEFEQEYRSLEKRARADMRGAAL
ncbi:MAG TPA: hydantoinase/oxoprolinase family protein, partial [Bryobacteraceae bacterium]|nr:hydantoinase/oxoprolinase family protein [Bryobacteraceae bacterium]